MLQPAIASLCRIDELQRKALIKKLGLDKDGRSEQAWSVAAVREAYRNNKTAFIRKWRKELKWLPTWKCPADFYFKLRKPVELDPLSLTGKKKLISMYGSYQQIDRRLSLRLLDAVGDDPKKSIAAINIEQESDLPLDFSHFDGSPTSAEALVKVRIGQAEFRADLMKIWEGKCAVTGCAVRQVLRASHVKPWSECKDNERRDPANGLLLAAHLDALFDAGLVSFADDGVMLISPELPDDAKEVFGLPGGLRVKPNTRLAKYLKYHRQHVGRGISSTN